MATDFTRNKRLGMRVWILVGMVFALLGPGAAWAEDPADPADRLFPVAKTYGDKWRCFVRPGLLQTPIYMGALRSGMKLPPIGTVKTFNGKEFDFDAAFARKPMVVIFSGHA